MNGINRSLPVPRRSTTALRVPETPSLHLLPTFVDDDGESRPNPVATRLDGRNVPDRGQRRRRLYKPWRTEVVERLAEERMLPAIAFVFSRTGCDQAVEQCLASGIRLTDADERRALRAIAERHVESLSDADLDVLGYDMWLAGMEAGSPRTTPGSCRR